MIWPVVGAKHKESWKILMALKKMKAWKGKYTKSTQYNPNHLLELTHNDSVWIQSCVRPPLLLVVGDLKLDLPNHHVTCQECRLFSCVNSSFYNTDHSAGRGGSSL
ncbi:PREDICTED: endogenous retrovirus group K member 18 Env polyprotein-like [Colobus angolensis palliatus]|uniref:endogenous retrovirus group K member 18 Env polyprotein-like n=1 Tax=Colobus angolensis palliatus TaxID=336983 RepID=UPI0005F56150|nr:PREDICTED: endogenous retrovirus group K member 18 Env polyprotein-like [Colobus angolensis palliatus]